MKISFSGSRSENKSLKWLTFLLISILPFIFACGERQKASNDTLLSTRNELANPPTDYRPCHSGSGMTG